MNAHDRAVLFSSKTDQHATPRALAAGCVELYRLDLDVCADKHNAVVPQYFDAEADGLKAYVRGLWKGRRVWCNPPYGRGIGDWVESCASAPYESLLAPEIAVMLLPARTDTAWWHEFIWNLHANTWRPGVRGTFFRGRLKFGNAKNSAPFPSALVVFGY